VSSETIEFQAEARQLLQLMIHSIYSTKDVFLRELISNASDALDKLRLAAFADKDLDVATDDLHITLETDTAERTLTVRDNGIGMSREEVVSLIGTIAKSGTAEMLAQLREARETDSVAAAELIGQFGVGFYASFMVADKVELVTRKAGSDAGVRWESRGEGHLHRRRGTGRSAGHRRHPAPQAGDTGRRAARLREPGDGPATVKRYSDFITWPIRMDSADGEPETVNSRKALWARRRRTSRTRSTPSSTATSATTGASRWRPSGWPPRAPSSTRRCCSCPSHAPMDLFWREAKRGVQLYVKRVFIMDDCEALVPEYLRFVKGVVDANDLSLNISREILQQDRQIQLIRKRLVQKVLSTVKTMQEKEPEKYATFWSELGRAVKEGMPLRPREPEGDPRDLLVLLHARPREADDAARLPRPHARGPGRDLLRHRGVAGGAGELAAHGGVPRQGIRGAAADDPVDEVWVGAVPSFEDKELTSIATGEVDLGGDDVDDDTKEGFAELLAWMGGALEEDVKEVRLSHRLTDSAACLVGEPGDLTPTLEKMYRAMGQEPPKVKRHPGAQPEARAGRPACATAHGRRPGRHGARPTPRACSTAWRCSPRAVSCPSPPRSCALLSRSWSSRSRPRDAGVSRDPVHGPLPGLVVPAHGRHRGDRRGEPADVGPGVRRQHHRHHRDARAGVGGHPRRRAGDRAGRARDVRARGLRGREADRAVRRPPRAAAGVDDGGRAGLRRGGGPGGRAR
jgi:molecular chaperone HtpG